MDLSMIGVKAQATDAAPYVAPVKSSYLNVYLNKGQGLRTHPYRVAILLERNSPSEHWVNYGLFKCEHVAAYAMNVHSICNFQGNSLLNPVDTTLADADELAAWSQTNRDLILDAELIMNSKPESFTPRIWELRG